MRRLRKLSVLVFIVVTVIFALYQVRAKMQTDSTGPVITMDAESIEVSVTATEEELLAGITATDKKDGDVSSSLLIEQMGSFIEPGRREITVVAFDSDSHITRATREIIYTDYSSPVFSKSTPFEFAAGTSDLIGDLTVTDVLDGDLTTSILISNESTISYYTAGTYSLVYSVTNSAGDTVELPVEITIYDDNSDLPQFTLSDYLVYIEKGASFNAWDYVKQITMLYSDYVRASDGRLYQQNVVAGETVGVISSSDVTIRSTVNTSEAGVYSVLYRLTDSNGNTGTTRLYVVVQD